MSVLTDFFLASDAEFADVLVGWKRAAPLLDEPRSISVTDPYSKETINILSRTNPEQPKADPDAVEQPDLDRLQRIRLEGADPTSLINLGEVLAGWSPEIAGDEALGREVIGPMHEEVTIFELSDALVTTLAEVENGDIPAKGTAWSDNYQAEEEAIDDELFGTIPQTPPEVWARHLRQLVDLARDAQKTQRRMYMWAKSSFDDFPEPDYGPN